MEIKNITEHWKKGFRVVWEEHYPFLNENPFKRVFVWYLNKHLAEPLLIVVGLRNFCRL